MLLTASSFAAIDGADGTKSINGAYITYNGTDKGGYGAGGVSYLTDGVRNTFGARHGGEIKIEFGSEVSFSGIRVWMSDNCVSGAEGRHSDSAMNSGPHRRAEVLSVKISSDGSTWTELSNEREANDVFWYDDYTFGKSVNAKYISLISRKGNDGWGEWEIGEIALITDEDISSKVKAEAKPETKNEAENEPVEGAYSVEGTWTFTASSTFYSLSADKAFDGDIKTFWHSSYEAAGGAVTSKAPYPHYIDVDFDNMLSVAGVIYTPRPDNMAGRFNSYTIYGSDDGANFEEIKSGMCDYSKGATPQIINFDEKVSVKVLRIETTDAGDDFGSAAEITILKEKVKVEEKESAPVEEGVLAREDSWKIEGSSVFYFQVAANAFDGNENTYWHTSYEAENGQITTMAPYPHYLSVDFGKNVTLYGIVYVPRKGNQGGVFNNYTIYGSTDGEEFKKITSGNFIYTDGITAKTVEFEKSELRAIKIETTDSISNVGTAGEIKFLTKKPEKEAVKKAPVTGDGKSLEGVPFLDRTGWIATGKSFISGSPMRMLDGDTKTHWHSDYQAADGVVTGRDNPPYTLEITLPEAKVISGISLHPRGDGMDTGKILKLNVYVAKDDTSDYFLLFENTEFPLATGNKDPREIAFNANISVKKVKLEILESAQHFGTLGEFNLWEERSEFKTVSFEDFYEEDSKNRLYRLDTKEFTASYDGDCWNDFTIDKAFDGPDGVIFQTEELKDSAYPVVLSLDMGRVRTFSEMHYVPRQTQDLHGLWTKFSVQISEDGENWTTLLAHEVLEKDLTTKKFIFDTPVKARYIDFEIEESMVHRVACTEIEFYQNKEAHDAENKVADKKPEKYELTIGSNVIKSEKDGVASEKTIDVAPYIVDGSTLIPLRGLVEEMGAEISWDGASKKITLKTADATIVLQIWNRRVFVTTKELGEVRYTLLNFPVIKDSRTFIPVRFVSEQLGYNVAWDGATQTVTITK